MRPSTERLTLTILFCLGLIIRAVLILSYATDYNEDAYSHTILSYITARTGSFPGVAWLPLYHYVGAAAIILLGGFATPNVVCRLASALFGALTVFPAYKATHRIAGPKIALGASILVATAPSLAVDLSTSAMQEALFTFLLMISISSILERRVLLSGILLAVSSLARYEGWVVTPLFALTLLSMRDVDRMRRLLAVVLSTSTIAAWIVWNVIRTGTLFAFYYAEIKPAGYTPIHYLKLLPGSLDYALLIFVAIGVYISLEKHLTRENLTLLAYATWIFLFHSFRGVLGPLNLGDWSIRFLAPILPPLLSYAALGIQQTSELLVNTADRILPRTAPATKKLPSGGTVYAALLALLCIASLVIANYTIQTRDRDSRYASLRAAGQWLNSKTDTETAILCDSPAVKYYAGLDRNYVSYWDLPQNTSIIHSFLEARNVRFAVVVTWEDWYPSAQRLPDLTGVEMANGYALRASFGYGTYIYELLPP